MLLARSVSFRHDGRGAFVEYFEESLFGAESVGAEGAALGIRPTTNIGRAGHAVGIQRGGHERICSAPAFFPERSHRGNRRTSHVLVEATIPFTPFVADGGIRDSPQARKAGWRAVAEWREVRGESRRNASGKEVRAGTTLVIGQQANGIVKNASAAAGVLQRF